MTDEEEDLYIRLKTYITLRYDIRGEAFSGVREAFGYGAASCFPPFLGLVFGIA
jgi:hypothetical protein